MCGTDRDRQEVESADLSNSTSDRSRRVFVKFAISAVPRRSSTNGAEWGTNIGAGRQHFSYVS